MNELKKQECRLISSVDLLNRTGLSRATLNNYIKIGMVPRPLIKRPSDIEKSRAKRIGYFSESVLGTLDEIVQYKKKGYSIERIRKRLSQKSSLSSEQNSVERVLTKDAEVRSSGGVYESEELFSLEEIPSENVKSDSHEERFTKKLTAHEKANQKIFQQQIPIPLTFSVLAADLQDSARISAELTPEMYFDVINRLWIGAKSAFEKYYGIYGQQAGYGMVYYFLKDRDSNYLLNAILCAFELREKMKNVSEEWKMDTGSCRNLFFNFGIDEGYEYFGRIPAAPSGEVVSLGDTVESAVRLCRFARGGSIWVTKNLLNRLDEKDRKKIRFGIHHHEQTHDILTENTFSRITDLVSKNADNKQIIDDISSMIVTEIYNIR